MFQTRSHEFPFTSFTLKDIRQKEIFREQIDAFAFVFCVCVSRSLMKLVIFSSLCLSHSFCFSLSFHSVAGCLRNHFQLGWHANGSVTFTKRKRYPHKRNFIFSLYIDFLVLSVFLLFGILTRKSLTLVCLIRICPAFPYGNIEFLRMNIDTCNIKKNTFRNKVLPYGNAGRIRVKNFIAAYCKSSIEFGYELKHEKKKKTAIDEYSFEK